MCLLKNMLRGWVEQRPHCDEIGIGPLNAWNNCFMNSFVRLCLNDVKIYINFPLNKDSALGNEEPLIKGVYVSLRGEGFQGWPKPGSVLKSDPCWCLWDHIWYQKSKSELVGCRASNLAPVLYIWPRKKV